MNRSNLLATVSLLAASLLSAAAYSQQKAPSAGGAAQPGGQQTYGGSGPGPGGPPPEQESGAPQASPVILVTSVEVLRSDRAGGLDIVRARGLVTSQGWSTTHLVPISQGQPIDGVLDLVFQATAPGGAAQLGPFMPVEAILPVEAGHPYKGVRVRGGNNAVTLKTLPGYAETPPPKEDCAKCLGKYFVAKGANPAAGVPADNIVHEADLPYTLRIVKPTDGIPSYAFDPNRLTLVLTEDGRIADAAWD
jgi:hypothetical protein